MPVSFAAKWHMIKRIFGTDTEILEGVLFAKFSLGHLADVPLLSSGGSAGVPRALQRASWGHQANLTGNGGSLPPRTPEARQFLWVCFHNLKEFYSSVWHSSFAHSFDSVLGVLSGGGDAETATKVQKLADMYLFMLLNGALASWSTSIWTKEKGLPIEPHEAAERLARTFYRVLDDIRSGAVEAYPHIDYFGQNGRFSAIIAATETELKRRAVVRRLTTT